MKKNYFILLAMALLFGACDRIENPVTVAKNKYRDDLYGPAPTFNALKVGAGPYKSSRYLFFATVTGFSIRSQAPNKRAMASRIK